MLIQLLKNFKLSKNKAALAFIIFALLMSLGCGKRKPPLPPVERVSQRTEISGFQQGNKVKISWTMPARNASNKSTLNIDRTDIYRLLEPLSSPLTLSEEEFSSRSTLIGTLPVSEADFNLKKITYTDTLELAGQSVRIRYAIRFVNASGQKASFSNFLLIEPASAVADMPNNLNVKLTKEFIKLSWLAPSSNVDGSQPANILGYNIYRSADSGEIKLINSSPITNIEFLDKSFEFGKRYKYFIRSVSMGDSGVPIESLDSNSVEILTRDIFPPLAPNAITIAAAPSNLSIFFASNSEEDVVGYKIYRSTDLNQPKSGWKLLTPNLLITNTYQDKNIETGKTYYYYLIAVDKASNESEPSEVVSETAP